MSEMISIGEWAKEKGISKQWAITLAGDGRLPGAMIVDNYRWMVPVGTPSPTRKVSDRMIEAERKRKQKAREKAEKEELYSRVRARMEAEDRETELLVRSELDDEMKRGIDWIVSNGKSVGQTGLILTLDATGKEISPPTGPVPHWNEDSRVRRYYLEAKKRYDAAHGAPVAVPSAPTVNPDWPSNEEESERAYDIREGVLSDPPLTLEQIKAQLTHWGADEQSYYDSLVAGTLNAL